MKKVLVIDDDLDILSLVQMTLELNKFIVKTVSRWQEIDAAIMEFVPDLILLDVSLGGADGRNICTKLKQDEATKNIAVILFSANSDMAKYYSACKAEAFLPKPFSIRTLIDLIKHHTSSLPDNSMKPVN